MILKEDQEYFKILTTDNGSEFSNLSQLENGLKDIKAFSLTLILPGKKELTKGIIAC